MIGLLLKILSKFATGVSVGVFVMKYSAFSPNADTNDSRLDLTSEHVRAIRKIIRSFIRKKKWEEEANSIWTYSEIRPRLIKHWFALWWLEYYLKSNTDAEAYFYDSW